MSKTYLGDYAYETIRERILRCEYAPNTYTAGKYAAVYGDFRTGYMICDGDGLYIQVLNELYATNNSIGYLVEYFGDGAPVVGEAFARLKIKGS